MAEKQEDGTPLGMLRNFKAATIARSNELGSSFDFSPAVPPATGIVELFRQISPDILPELPDQLRSYVEQQSDACWRVFQSLLSFNPQTAQNATQERQNLIGEIRSKHFEAFTQLTPVLAYAAARVRNLTESETKAATLLEVAQEASGQIQELKDESQRILADVRQLAGKAGVSKQAPFFRDQADAHSTSAGTWQNVTYGTAAVLVLFALGSLWLSYQLVPANNYQAVQLGLSKVLIFSTIAYLLFLSSRTLMAHRHNEIVNRHRQNALLTFNALADAASGEQTRDVVLTHASQCIFAPQESGFTKAVASTGPMSMIEVVPKVMGAEHVG